MHLPFDFSFVRVMHFLGLNAMEGYDAVLAAFLCYFFIYLFILFYFILSQRSGVQYFALLLRFFRKCFESLVITYF